MIMYLTEGKSVRYVEREINRWISEGQVTPERFDVMMRYVFFKTVTTPEIVRIFRNARINMPVLSHHMPNTLKK